MKNASQEYASLGGYRSQIRAASGGNNYSREPGVAAADLQVAEADPETLKTSRKVTRIGTPKPGGNKKCDRAGKLSCPENAYVSPD